ncbi:MAG: trimethylamine methyltransferase family protein, partial [Kiloniellales bacterium]
MARNESRSSERRRRHGGGPKQLPWGQPVNRFRPLEILSADQLEAIHQASLTVLEEIGIEVLSQEALRLFEAAGASLDRSQSLVCLDRALVEEKIALAPAAFTLAPRNPDHALEIGGNYHCFSLVAGPPSVSDLDRGRRPGNFEDYCNLLRLAQSLNVIHYVGNQPVAPIELNAEQRHLDCYRANATLTDRVFQVSAIGAERAIDGIAIAALARGESLEELAKRPAVATIINVNSPRRLDGPMSDGLIAMARHGQPVIVTPFTLMGAMTPVTLAAALVQQNAEALFGIVLVQLAKAGAPVIYGGFTSNVDMKSGAPAFGTPEYT